MRNRVLSLSLAALFLVSGCWLEHDKKKNKENSDCASSSDFLEFHCIDKNDFRDANGAVTPLSQGIVNCTLLSSTSSFCPLSSLGFIGNTSATPTKQQILDRLVVSDPWMAANFSQLLDNMPADMFDLFASVTAIVIHREIRPAFFWPSTGAIYLDPYYLWLSPDQFNSISKENDYRSGYDNELLYESMFRYTKNGVYAFGYGNSRTSDQALYALSALLFHELAHARDVFPLTTITSSSPTLTPDDISIVASNTSISKQLDLAFPLSSDKLKALAQVKFFGAPTNAELKSVTAIEAGTEFELDGANDDYAYASIREDTAMLFEEAMMKIHYNIDREFAFATPLNTTLTSCADYSFDWVTINRFSNSIVLPRASFVVTALLPEQDHSAFLNNPISSGVYSWCGSSSAKSAPYSSNDSIPQDFWH